MVSSSLLVSAAPSFLRGRTPHTLPQLQHEVLSRETALHDLPNMSPSHGLWLFMNCPTVSPFHGVPSFRNRLLQRGSPMGSQALSANLLQRGPLSLHRSTGLGRSLLQHGLPTGSQPPSGIHLLRPGVPSTGCRWTSAPPWTSMGCRDSLPHHGLLHGLQKNLCSGIWSTSSPSSFTGLAVCRVVSLPSSRSSLSTAASPQVFSASEMCYPRGAATVAGGLGLGQWWVCLRAGWHWLYQMGGSSSQLLTEATSIAPPATQTSPRKPTSLTKMLKSAGASTDP